MTLFSFALERYRADLIAELSRAQKRCDTKQIHKLTAELKRVTTEVLREGVRAVA